VQQLARAVDANGAAIVKQSDEDELVRRVDFKRKIKGVRVV
jgi:hypothetical protein